MSWRWGSVLLAAMVLALITSAAGLAAGSGRTNRVTEPLRLVLPHHRLRAGEVVQVEIINRSSRPVIRTGCFILQLREPDAWKTINSTHGIRLPCTPTDSSPEEGRPDYKWSLVLYDDLRPGRYRITLLYKFLPEHWRTASLHGHLRTLRASLRVLKFHLGPPPHLPERSLKRTALAAATRGGDRHPSLIQHAEGTRFAANLVSGGGLVFDWSWAYLIAIRGHFKLKDVPRPPGASPPVGSVLTIVIDAKTGRGEVDLGLSNHDPNLAKLGKVTTDYRR